MSTKIVAFDCGAGITVNLAEGETAQDVASDHNSTCSLCIDLEVASLEAQLEGAHQRRYAIHQKNWNARIDAALATTTQKDNS